MRSDDHLDELRVRGRLVAFLRSLYIVLLTVLRDRMQLESRLVLHGCDRVRRGPHHEHVACFERCIGSTAAMAHAMPEPLDDAEPPLEALLKLRERLADPRRLGLDDELGVIAIEAQVIR